VIKTVYKCKLPPSLAYPLGSETIDRATVGFPHAGKFELRFSDISLIRKLGDRPSIYPILHLQYSNHPPSVSSPGDGSLAWIFGEHWTLTVYPVPSTRKAMIKQLLLSEGFGRIHAWLSLPRPPIWFSGCKRIEVNFDEGDGALLSREHASL